MQLFLAFCSNVTHMRNSASSSSSASNTTWPGVWGRSRLCWMCWSSGQDGRATGKQLEWSLTAQHLKTKALRCTVRFRPSRAPVLSTTVPASLRRCRHPAVAGSFTGPFLSPSSRLLCSSPHCFWKVASCCKFFSCSFQTRGEGAGWEEKKGHLSSR